MELDLGQQVSLIGSTPEDRVIKASVIPLSEAYTPGYARRQSGCDDFRHCRSGGGSGAVIRRWRGRGCPVDGGLVPRVTTEEKRSLGAVMRCLCLALRASQDDHEASDPSPHFRVGVGVGVCRYFEVVTEKFSADDPFSRILDTLAVGEIIQVRNGVCWGGAKGSRGRAWCRILSARTITGHGL
jgi:hypothetical protein